MGNWTEFDLIAYNARQSALKASIRSPNGGCDDESELHEQIRQECLRRGWMAFHGSMAHRAYRTPGEPDYVILCDGGKLLMVECKTRVGKLSTEQLGVAAWASKLGHKVHTVRSYEEFLNVANQTTT